MVEIELNGYLLRFADDWGIVTLKVSRVDGTPLQKDYFEHFVSVITSDDHATTRLFGLSPDTLELYRKLNMRVDQFDLPPRAANRLSEAGITFIGDLVQMTKRELLNYPNFSDKSLKAITDMLANLGLRLGMEPWELHDWQRPG